jgi:DNA polymerase III gamma/tau subunit
MPFFTNGMEQSLFKEYQGAFVEKDLPAQTGDAPKKQNFFGFNPFPLQDALGEKNTKKVWIEYEKLRNDGIEAEELIHKIVSKVRDMAMIILGAKAEDLVMKDFPFNKSRAHTKNWKVEDLKNLYTKLVAIYHESRMSGGEELDIALEKVLLKL